MEKLDISVFRKNLLEIRRAKMISAKELSIMANLKQQKRINDIEEGRGNPSLEEVYSICHALKISIDDMLTKNLKIKFEFEETIPMNDFLKDLGQSSIPKTYS